MLKPTAAGSINVGKELFCEVESNEIEKLQAQLAHVQDAMLMEWDTLVVEHDAHNYEHAKITSLKYQMKHEQFIKLNSALVRLYENEIQKLHTLNVEDHLSEEQKKHILNEIKEIEHLCSLSLRRDGDIECFINEKVFSTLLENFEEKCPLIHSILQSLLAPAASKRVHKTPQYKMKCGVHSLALLLSVRNQKIANDVRLLFGLLCISYGAGKQFVNLLNASGLSSHWDTMYVFFIILNKASLFIYFYLKALPSMAGQLQQLKANYSSPNNITIISYYITITIICTLL